MKKNLTETFTEKEDLGTRLAELAAAKFTSNTGRKISHIAEERGEFPISHSALANMKKGQFSEHTRDLMVEYIGLDMQVQYTISLPAPEEADLSALKQFEN